MLFANYKHKFLTDSGRLIFDPAPSSREFGNRLHQNILRQWTPPSYFFHFQDGGHVAATRAHLASTIFLRLDLAQFFDTVTRSRVHRALRRVGFKQRYAWDAARESTVSKDNTKRGFSLPFGFVQSPAIASIVLATSALGRALDALHNNDMRLSVYMDDIILSGDAEAPLRDAREKLEIAAAEAGFQFNPTKTVGPAGVLEVFNLVLSHDSIVVSAQRMADFIAALRSASAATADGIIGYVGTINDTQRALLAAAWQPEQ